jgi:hypothetical protein
MTFDAAFKKLYAEELAPYGFQKVKGRSPYFVRMVGDEIAHVITYRNHRSIRPYKYFAVLWGVATVYRTIIDLETPPEQTLWMHYVKDKSLRLPFGYLQDKYIAEKLVPGESFNMEGTYVKLIKGIGYDVGGNNVNMMEGLEYSVEAVKRITLPLLDQVSTLRACIDCTNTTLWEYDDFRWGETMKAF